MVTSYDNKIISVVARHPGSAYDSRIFNASRMKERLEEGDLRGYLLIGDQGYACSSFLLTPVRFPKNDAEKRYNYDFIRTRGCVERTFGILKSRFSVLGPDSRIRLNAKKASAVVVACAVLHSMCMERGIPVQVQHFHQLHVFNQGQPSSNLGGNAFRSVLIRRFFE